ncbi:hypothetical protein HPT25_16895 [Bacillus sp. BRMEA1]|uniref:hypothetical protein n=1 Tax=Neobacillus endophyticus TaxID=2738405 RepID=UPI001566E0AA|nr:hypothetical protein [Neobacillus endophyticus]NRD79038.1 hypothetical protein [Neobacillus endophyticus]
MKKMIIGTLFLFVIIASGCSNSPKTSSGYAKMEWMDFIKLNGHSYQVINTGTLSDPSLVGKEIGIVKFMVSDNVTKPNYKIKDGDAAFLEKGTKIYEVKENPDLVVVKDQQAIGGYSVYYRDRGSYNYHFKNLNQNEVKKIQIYEDHGDTKLEHRLLSTLTDSSQIKNFFGVLNQGKEDSNFRYDHSHPDQKVFTIVFYTKKAVAYRDNILYNGKEYGWTPWSQEVLPVTIEKFLNNKQFN